MTFAKDNAAEEGFNRWTINGVAYPMTEQYSPGRISPEARQAISTAYAQRQR